MVYLHQSTLFAVPFDPGRLALAGLPAPILEDVSGSAGAGGLFAFGGAPSGPGTFAYLAGMRQGLQPISWLDSAGKIQPLHAPPGVYSTPRFSPDGDRLAFAVASGTGTDVWVKDLGRDTLSRLTFLAGVNRLPVWTPDGKNIVFTSSNPAAPGLYWVPSDGSGEAQRLSDGKLVNEFPTSFSPDGRRLAFCATGGSSADIFTASFEGDHAIREISACFEDCEPSLDRWPVELHIGAVSKISDRCGDLADAAAIAAQQHPDKFTQHRKRHRDKFRAHQNVGCNPRLQRIVAEAQKRAGV